MGARKILAVTGIRSEYDILAPVLNALRVSGDYRIQVAVSGAHLSDWHGNTMQRIEDDEFEIVDCIDSLFMTNRKAQRVKGVAALTTGLAQTVEREQPDFLLVVGDREESIATAMVGNYMDTLTAHIGGGDPAYGNADDPIRFAVSKLSHIHLTTAQAYADNLKTIGEDEFRTFFVGNPSLDNIRMTGAMTLEQLSEMLDIDIRAGRYLMFLQHPLSSEKDQAYTQMHTSLTAIQSFCEEHDYKAIGIYPNTDPGSYDIVRAVDEFRDVASMHFFRNLDREPFINLMRHTRALMGNSSMGILEAPFYGTPVVNIGNRQKGRLNAGNVEFAEHNVDAIKESLHRACFDDDYRGQVKNLENPYGDGQAATRIVDALSNVDLTDSKWYVKNKLC